MLLYTYVLGFISAGFQIFLKTTFLTPNTTHQFADFAEFLLNQQKYLLKKACESMWHVGMDRNKISRAPKPYDKENRQNLPRNKKVNSIMNFLRHAFVICTAW